jgi:hypothetical protein
LVPCDETRAEAEPTVMVWMTEPSEALSSLTVRHRRRSVWCALHYSGEAFRQDLFHCGPHPICRCRDCIGPRSRKSGMRAGPPVHLLWSGRPDSSYRCMEAVAGGPPGSRSRHLGIQRWMWMTLFSLTGELSRFRRGDVIQVGTHCRRPGLNDA